MTENLLSIGKMAEMNHVTVPTLRLYDQMGLLRPHRTDGATGYRYYTIEQNARLDLIAYMKELGMSLSEIGDVLRKEDITLIESILVRKNEQIHEQIRALHAQHDAVERAIACIERYRKSPAKGTIALEYIDRRYIWGIPCGVNFYETGIRDYEKALIALRKALTAHHFSQIHSYNTGTSIRQDAIVEGDFVPESVFVFIDRRAAEAVRDAKVVESGMFACIYLDQFDEEIPCAKRLLDFIGERGWRVCGDYICEVLTEFNVFDSESRSMFLRLQIPVAFDGSTKV